MKEKKKAIIVMKVPLRNESEGRRKGGGEGRQGRRRGGNVAEK